MKLDLFDQKDISPMLLSESEPFDHKDYIFELKLDGIRALAYLDKKETIIKNKRNKDITNIYPELKSIHKQVNKRCILDGEIIVMKNGRPDFFALQSRSILSDSLKISLASKLNTASFVAYDILYYDKKDITDWPLLKRKEVLKEIITENEFLSYSRFIEEKGREFYELARDNHLEGIVAKEKISKYYIGKRAKVWIKMKVMQEEDLIICGYIKKDGTIKDLILGIYDKDYNLHFRGTIYLGVSTIDKNKIIDTAIKHPSPPLFALNNKGGEIIWMKPLLVGVVKYMMKTKSGGMRQPIFKGLRDDKIATECIDPKI